MTMQACEEEEEDADIIEKREVVIEYPVESNVVEENMSRHTDKVEVKWLPSLKEINKQ